MNDEQSEITNEDPRWRMLRDLGVLQVKLLIDGMRDLLLVPASLIAGIISIVSGKDGKPGPQFYELLDIGKQSELWINLFGALKHAPQRELRDSALKEDGVDDLVSKLETYVVEEVKRGGVTAQAKARLDKILDSLQRNQTSNN